MPERRRTLDDFTDHELLTVPEVAECLRLSTDAIYEMVHRSELPAVRLGRKIRLPAFGLRQWIATQAGVNAPPKATSIASPQTH